MRSLTLVIAASLALAVPSMSTAEAKPAKPQPDLVTKAVTATLTGSTLAVSATVTNKGKKKAKASVTSFQLSKDGTSSADDVLLASVGTAALKPKKSATVSGSATLAATVAPGTYQVVACADGGTKVKEKKETNNCAVSGAVTVAAKPSITVAWRATAFGNVAYGSVTATATGGTCTAPGVSGTCTITPGASTVTLTATSVQPPFTTVSGWAADSGAVCTGTVSGANSEVFTITNPAVNQGCVLSYQVVA